ncbi:unnamed protein product [Rodentolepis nana]|uniref:Uncharacterized protein n=1 Tax=Rodentolepis nana TaxID=102285 RepID=A0A0R3T757_RODNA|nr:unnamed protein product [Rodentolepis nana]
MADIGIDDVLDDSITSAMQRKSNNDRNAVAEAKSAAITTACQSSALPYLSLSRCHLAVIVAVGSGNLTPRQASGGGRLQQLLRIMVVAAVSRRHSAVSPVITNRSLPANTSKPFPTPRLNYGYCVVLTHLTRD